MTEKESFECRKRGRHMWDKKRGKESIAQRTITVASQWRRDKQQRKRDRDRERDRQTERKSETLTEKEKREKRERRERRRERDK